MTNEVKRTKWPVGKQSLMWTSLVLIPVIVIAVVGNWLQRHDGEAKLLPLDASPLDYRDQARIEIDLATADLEPVVQIGDYDEVWAVAFSADGRRVVTRSADGIVRVWDANTGEVLRAFQDHRGAITSVALSPDGRHSLTGHHDRTARMWDFESGELVRNFEGHTNSINAVAFSADGRQVLTGSTDNSARLWDAETGKTRRAFTASDGPIHGTYCVAFSPDGRRVATGSWKTARLWDVESGNMVRNFGRLVTTRSGGTYLDGHGGRVTSVTFSPDGRQLFTGSSDRTARLWDTETGEELHRFEHSHIVYGGNAFAFSPDGQRVLTGTWENAHVWDVQTGRELLRLGGHAFVNTGAFSPDGRRVLTGASRSRLWDAETGELIRTFLGYSTNIRLLDFSADGRHLITEGAGAVHVWDSDLKGAVHSFYRGSDGTGVFTRGAASPDGRRLVTWSNDNVVRLWDAESGKELHKLVGHTDSVWKVAFSPDGRYLLTGSYDKRTRLWDSETGELLHTFRGHGGAISRGSFSPDGRRVLTHSDDNRIVFMSDTESGEFLTRFQGRSGVPGNVNTIINNAVFSPDSRHVLSAGEEPVRMWDAESGRELQRFEGLTDVVDIIAFSPDSRRVLTASWDHLIRLWDPETGEVLHILEGHSSKVTSVAFSPDGQRLITGSSDRTALLWDTKTGEELHRFEHSNYVRRFAFSPNGRSVLMVGAGLAHLWDAESGEHLHTFEGSGARINSYAFSRDGLRIALASGRELRLYNTSNGKLLGTAYVLNEENQWLALTPGGHFNGAEGAEAYLRYRTPGTLDVYPVNDQLRERFQTTTVIQQSTSDGADSSEH